MSTFFFDTAILPYPLEATLFLFLAVTLVSGEKLCLGWLSSLRTATEALPYLQTRNALVFLLGAYSTGNHRAHEAWLITGYRPNHHHIARQYLHTRIATHAHTHIKRTRKQACPPPPPTAAPPLTPTAAPRTSGSPAYPLDVVEARCLSVCFMSGVKARSPSSSITKASRSAGFFAVYVIFRMHTTATHPGHGAQQGTVTRVC